MPQMTLEELNAFLARPHLARITTVRPDQKPHIAPMWFYWDGASLFMETPPTAVKTRNLRSNPACAVCIDVTEGGLRFKGVILEGMAELLDDRELQLTMTTRIYTKYLGSEGVQAPTPQHMIHNPHVIIKLTPTRIISWDETQDGLAPIP